MRWTRERRQVSSLFLNVTNIYYGVIEEQILKNHELFYCRLKGLLSKIYDTGESPGKIIIFVETKRRVDNLVRFIRSFGVRCGAIHGDKSQSERDFVLREFRSGKSNILVATDVAARGLGKYKL